VDDLSLDYAQLLAGVVPVVDAEAVGGPLLDAIGEVYLSRHGDGELLVFVQAGSRYVFDHTHHTDSAGLAWPDRTVAAWAVTPDGVGRRDVAYQRGFPMEPDAAGSPADRGHLIPHLSGG
jgi:hypothetical protein